MTKAEYQKEWRRRNPEKVKEYVRRWRANNPERAKALAKSWRERNRDRVRIKHEEYVNRSRPPKSQNRNHYAHWTGEHDTMVLNHTMIDLELHKLIGRTLRAIQNRRYKLNKISDIRPIVKIYG